MMRARRLSVALAALILALGGSAPARAQGDASTLAGLYSGSQAEVGTMLELGEDGRYRYQLAYGALDEWSAGTWTSEDNAIVLQSDPFKAPLFTVSGESNQSGELSVKLDLPDGFDPQYFAIALHRKDGTASFERIASGSMVIAMGDNPVVSARPVLPVMDLFGPSFAVPGGGADLKISFEPNDLGFVGFSREILPRSGDAFELQRHELTLRFRRVGSRR